MDGSKLTVGGAMRRCLDNVDMVCVCWGGGDADSVDMVDCSVDRLTRSSFL